MDIDFNDPEVKKAVETHAATMAEQLVQDRVKAAIDAEVSGLKEKNSDLIKEKKLLQDQLQQFDGVDVNKIRELVKQFENDEEAKLIADGKIDDVLQLRTERMRSAYESQVNKLSEDLANVSKDRDSLVNQYNSFAVEVEIRKAAERAEVLPEAIDDILRRSVGVFSFEDGKILAKDSNGKLKMSAKGDSPYAPDDYLEELKENAAYYWPASKGLGASGGQSPSDPGEFAARLQKAAESGDMKTYRKLREEQKKGTGA